MQPSNGVGIGVSTRMDFSKRATLVTSAASRYASRASNCRSFPRGNAGRTGELGDLNASDPTGEPESADGVTR